MATARQPNIGGSRGATSLEGALCPLDGGMCGAGSGDKVECFFTAVCMFWDKALLLSNVYHWNSRWVSHSCTMAFKMGLKSIGYPVGNEMALLHTIPSGTMLSALWPTPASSEMNLADLD